MKILLAAFVSFGLMLQAAAPVPRPATPFKITEPSGQQVDITSFKGKVVLCQFLFTWCPHCQNTAKMLTKLQNEFGPKGLQIIGIAFNDTPSEGAPAADAKETAKFQANNAGFPVGYVKKADAMKYLGISVMESFAVPQIMIIDRNGIIQNQDLPKPTPELQTESFLRPLLTKLLDQKAGSGGGGAAKKADTPVSEKGKTAAKSKT
jgi:peroxiredoxin